MAKAKKGKGTTKKTFKGTTTQKVLKSFDYARDIQDDLNTAENHIWDLMDERDELKIAANPKRYGASNYVGGGKKKGKKAGGRR